MKRKRTLGAWMVGGLPPKEENIRDFYATPPEAIRALVWNQQINKNVTIWEPACGDGAIAKVLKKMGHKVVATDLTDRGYGTAGVDFLKQKRGPPGCGALITNPPFSLLEDFIRKSHELEIPYVALLMKATYWHAASRYSLFRKYRPAMILPLTWRLDFMKKGAPTMECSWCVWNTTPLFGVFHHLGATTTIYHPLPKTKPLYIRRR